MFERYFVLVLSVLNIQDGPRCRLNARTHFGEPLPVVLRNGRLLEPTDQWGNVDLENGERLTLSCEGAGTIVHPSATRQLATADIVCETGDNFNNNDWLSAPARFSLFRCVFPPAYVSETTNRTCYENHLVVEVGYRIEGTLYPVYESCFNNNTLNVIYSKYTQKPYNAYFQTRVDRPYFIDDGKYANVPVESLFSPGGQKNAVAKLVSSRIDTYITREQFLSRGHLAAKTDFPFAFGQRATFHYVNCAPQWYGFNSGNWNTLEVELRNRVNAAGYETIVYTGTFGVSQLTDIYGKRVDLYLFNDRNNNPVIPIPLYFYKVVYEPATTRGTAFVGINNPYYSPAEAKDLFFCRDVCRGNANFSWLIWRADSSSDGYAFCCTIPDFRNTVEHLPYFEVVGLLT
ncbi:hypothetical protein EVAR_88099_1 [Eumeta japonica]|uniref:DNA/RNA non-specific endonuclease/pyrophosphatase/phosphodiesterase domain-containing protein n=1 Tax=Eumeta variegata TaxID=151549 RepID=A0A4C1WGQ3_EUMVA|nr:hypothetical protein EVAR_88099_1 [Eumeta japonica]